MIAAEEWYAYQKQYQKYGLDMRPEEELVSQRELLDMLEMVLKKIVDNEHNDGWADIFRFEKAVFDYTASGNKEVVVIDFENDIMAYLKYGKRVKEHTRLMLMREENGGIKLKRVPVNVSFIA